MYEKQCKRCGCSMDPGEGRNGVCDDCITGRQNGRSAKNRLSGWSGQRIGRRWKWRNL